MGGPWAWVRAWTQPVERRAGMRGSMVGWKWASWLDRRDAGAWLEGGGECGTLLCLPENVAVHSGSAQSSFSCGLCGVEMTQCRAVLCHLHPTALQDVAADTLMQVSRCKRWVGRRGDSGTGRPASGAAAWQACMTCCVPCPALLTSHSVHPPKVPVGTQVSEKLTAALTHPQWSAPASPPALHLIFFQFKSPATGRARIPAAARACAPSSIFLTGWPPIQPWHPITTVPGTFTSPATGRSPSQRNTGSRLRSWHPTPSHREQPRPPPQTPTACPPPRRP